MKSSSSIAVIVAAVLLTGAAARAAHVDFKDPRRALGREDDIRVDAELVQDTISPGTPIGITYQVENLTSFPIAIADRVTDTSFDPDSQTITVTIGAEIPQGAAMPRLTTIAAGQKRSFRTGALAHFAAANARGPWAHVPRLVRIVVNVLRDIGPFSKLIAMQANSSTAPPLPNDLLDAWAGSVSSVELNALPVHWTEGRRGQTAESNNPARDGDF